MINDENRRLFKQLWSGDSAAREAIRELNRSWVEAFVNDQKSRANLAGVDLMIHAMGGLELAIDKFCKPEFNFAPDETFQGGYAIWWVRMEITMADPNIEERVAAQNNFEPVCIVETVCSRPEMYTANATLAEIYAFLSGHASATDEHAVGSDKSALWTIKWLHHNSHLPSDAVEDMLEKHGSDAAAIRAIYEFASTLPAN